MDIVYRPSVLNKVSCLPVPEVCSFESQDISTNNNSASTEDKEPQIGHVLRNPIVFSLASRKLQRLYDGFLSTPAFNIVILLGAFDNQVRQATWEAVSHFANPKSFRGRFTSRPIFKLHLVTMLDGPTACENLVDPVLSILQTFDCVKGSELPHHLVGVYLDDQPREESIHKLFGVEHDQSPLLQNRVLIARPDLWLGAKTSLLRFKQDVESYFDGFLCHSFVH